MATNQYSFARADFNSVTTPKICENTSGRWVEYGEDNDYFNYVIDQYNNSVTNAAIINTITTWIEGGGLTAANKSTNIAGFESFLKKFKEDCFSRVVEDFKLQGMAAYQIIWAKNRLNIAAIYHMPIQYLRPEIMDENGKINHWYYSEDWQDYRKKKYKPEPIPVFTGKYKGHDREVFVIKQYKAGLTYFGSPDYVSSMRWIEVEGKVSVFHLNNISNSFQPSMIISFNNGIPTSQEEINVTEMALKKKFGGDTNAGKAIILFNDSKERGVDVTVVPSSDLDKQYEFVSNHARQMIITGHKVTSPMLLGIKEDTGLGNNADEIKNATLLFQSTVIQGFQKQILASIDFISKADGLNFMWEIIPYVPIQFTEGQNESTVKQLTPSVVDVSVPDKADKAIDVEEDVLQKDTSYNGAQIASALEIVQQVQQGLLTKSQGIIFLMEFLKIDEALANKIFAEIDGGSTTFSKIKKMLFGDNVTDMTDSDEQEWLDYLKGKGELKKDFEQDYDLVSEEDASDDEEVFIKSFNQMNFAVEDYAEPGKRSKEADSGLYSLRYQYSQNISKDSREFCKEMVSAAKSGVIFRYEDIVSMSDAGVNGEFAPQGKSTYSIFKYKGGVYCHHSWKRLIYKRKTDAKGRIMPASTTKEMENDIRVGNNPYVKKKGIEGTPTIDLPNRGSLKNK